MKSRGLRLVTLVAIWAAAVVPTYEVASRGVRSKEMLGIWLTLILLATALTIPDRYWAPSVRVPTEFLFLSAVGYSLYLTGLDWTMLLGVLDVILPGLVWLVLGRLAPWPWVKSKWALVALLGGGIAIGCVGVLWH